MTSPLVRVAMIGQKGYPPVHGGIEKHVAELAARLPAHGFAVDIYSRPHYSRHQGTGALPDIMVRRLPSIPTKHLDAISHTWLATADVLRRDASLVHYHALGPGLFSGVPRWLGRRDSIVTVHGLDWQREKWGPLARLVLRAGEWASAALPTRTIVVSRALGDHYQRVHRRSVTYIPNGIVAPSFRGRDLLPGLGIDGPFVLFVARLVPEKGCHLLIEAWRGLSAALQSKYCLVIAGDAGFTDTYADGLRRDAPEGVRFLGYVHGPVLEELYTAADLMVLPSTVEGLSISLLEAMSYGRCCLVSDIPPNTEATAGHAETFACGDVDDLQRGLTALLQDPARRAVLGAAAQRHALENYSWDRVAAATAALYREILAGRHGRTGN